MKLFLFWSFWSLVVCICISPIFLWKHTTNVPLVDLEREQVKLDKIKNDFVNKTNVVILSCRVDMLYRPTTITTVCQALTVNKEPAVFHCDSGSVCRWIFN